jgi:hypothetical protein
MLAQNEACRQQRYPCRTQRCDVTSNSHTHPPGARLNLSCYGAHGVYRPPASASGRQAQIIDIVTVIALFGFLNRFNDTMATELEAPPIEAGSRFLAQQGWTVGSAPADRRAYPCSSEPFGLCPKGDRRSK